MAAAVAVWVSTVAHCPHGPTRCRALMLQGWRQCQMLSTGSTRPYCVQCAGWVNIVRWPAVCLPVSSAERVRGGQRAVRGQWTYARDGHFGGIRTSDTLLSRSARWCGPVRPVEFHPRLLWRTCPRAVVKLCSTTHTSDTPSQAAIAGFHTPCVACTVVLCAMCRVPCVADARIRSNTQSLTHGCMQRCTLQSGTEGRRETPTDIIHDRDSSMISKLHSRSHAMSDDVHSCAQSVHLCVP